MKTKPNSKALEFIYQDTEIHFLLGSEKDVMVNATEMGKLFGKEPKDFLRLDGTKKFIEKLIEKENIGADVPRYTKENVVNSNNKAGTYMCRKLALKFSAWLDVDFELWIIDTIDNLLFGHYKEHWEAHLKQEDAKKRMEAAKKKLLLNASQEDVIAYFKAENEFNSAKNEKSKAIKNQYSLFENIK